MKERWVIVYGSLGEGIQGVEGPFDSEEEADSYAETFNLGHFEKFIYKLNLRLEWADMWMNIIIERSEMENGEVP